MDEAQLPPPIHQPTETGSPSGSGGQASTSEGGQEKPRLEILTSRNFPAWLNLHKVSLGFSTYQSGKLYLVGLKEDNRLSIFERTFNRCMGLWSDGQTIWASTVFQLWRFENCLAEEETDNGYDRLYVPRMGYTTGDCDIHDIALDGDGRVVFINTLFGCLATTSDKHCFKPLWHPPFLSKLAEEDRCHLNGLAVVDGWPKFATAVSQSDVVDGWREHRRDGGCLMDIETNEIISSNLSMPHSPRWYDGHLWLLDSGSGFLGQIEPKHGAFEALTFCPGYARGLAFHGDYAVVGVSKPRHNKTFSGLALDDNLEERHAKAWCGLLVIDLKSGDVVHWLRLEGVVAELYDVIVLPGVRRPKALGFKTDEIRYTVSMEGGRSIWRGMRKEESVDQ